MNIGDQIKKVLDRGETVVIYRNGLGSYTAAVVSDSVHAEVDAMDDDALTLTDDFEPSKALHRLSEKVLRTGEYANWPNGEKEHGGE